VFTRPQTPSEPTSVLTTLVSRASHRAPTLRFRRSVFTQPLVALSCLQSRTDQETLKNARPVQPFACPSPRSRGRKRPSHSPFIDSPCKISIPFRKSSGRAPGVNTHNLQIPESLVRSVLLEILSTALKRRRYQGTGPDYVEIEGSGTTIFLIFLSSSGRTHGYLPCGRQMEEARGAI
jgi:hypothetical protein